MSGCQTAVREHAFAGVYDHGVKLGKSSEAYSQSVCYLSMSRVHRHDYDGVRGSAPKRPPCKRHGTYDADVKLTCDIPITIGIVDA